ncbi:MULTISPECIES: hypothetical protein [Streptomyces]|uniref:Uncharacterized protein n=3 Tax=Streptomyces TaxID=1883 RepID=A0A939FJ78_9ACTN|nr:MULTISPECIES: hypothetical protein [Streptomyces]MBO0652262.1 hypothetical protein [Streptomyces triculaminicus]MCA6093509.1 hypothetical protein [Streptomyces sichuanensis]QSY52117.1 hypothetical protein J3S04_15595 [Streptomyces griseocarneus]GHC37407.1 hypothetical protein GCM10010507_08530 [Streptomyces cinnamoneus]
MLVVSGGSTSNAVVRGRTGESVVLLSGDLPEVLTDRSVDELLDLAAAVLTDEEMGMFRTCLGALRRGERLGRRRVDVGGAVLTVYYEG